MKIRNNKIETLVEMLLNLAVVVVNLLDQKTLRDCVDFAV